jgi:hypothetical protein
MSCRAYNKNSRDNLERSNPMKETRQDEGQSTDNRQHSSMKFHLVNDSLSSRREVLRGALIGATGLALRPSWLFAGGRPADETPPKRYWLFPHPDGSECPNVKKKGILLVDM